MTSTKGLIVDILVTKPSEKTMLSFVESLSRALLADTDWAWQVALREGTVQRVFGFQSILVNYLRGCPREAVREVFYGGVIRGLWSRY